GHAAPADQVTAWLALLNGGVTVEQFKAALLGSSEFFQSKAAGSKPQWVNQVFQYALGRPATATEQSTWAAQAGATDATRSAAALAILLAPSGYIRKVVGDAYTHWLSRPATTDELNYWAGRFQQGASDATIFTELLTTPELYNRTTPIS